MKILFIKVFLFLLFGTSEIFAQIPVPFTFKCWEYYKYVQWSEIKEHVLEEYLSEASVRLRNTDAVLKNVNFINGIVEYEAAFPPDW